MSNNGQNRPSYLFLQSMSTDELENILAQETFADDEADTDYIMAIMEVIHDREKRICVTDPQAAWKDFQENYLGSEDAYLDDLPPGPTSDHLNQSPKRKSFPLKIAAIAAAVMVLLCGTASAFGFNFWKVFVNWTADKFGFESPYAYEHQLDSEDPYRNLRLAVSELTDISLLPNWAPEGTEAVDNISIAETSKGYKLRGNYKINDRQFTIIVRIYDVTSTNYSRNYQKSDDVKEIELSGITHYLMHNNENLSAAWVNENAEVQIQGNLSMDELDQMITSIYEE